MRRFHVDENVLMLFTTRKDYCLYISVLVVGLSTKICIIFNNVLIRYHVALHSDRDMRFHNDTDPYVCSSLLLSDRGWNL